MFLLGLLHGLLSAQLEDQPVHWRTRVEEVALLEFMGLLFHRGFEDQLAQVGGSMATQPL